MAGKLPEGGNLIGKIWGAWSTWTGKTLEEDQSLKATSEDGLSRGDRQAESEPYTVVTKDLQADGGLSMHELPADSEDNVPEREPSCLAMNLSLGDVLSAAYQTATAPFRAQEKEKKE